jgi:hypothetical protein
VRNHPPGGDGIEDALTVLQGEVRSLGAYYRRKRRTQRMLSKRMPDGRNPLTAHRKFSCMILKSLPASS